MGIWIVDERVKTYTEKIFSAFSCGPRSVPVQQRISLYLIGARSLFKHSRPCPTHDPFLDLIVPLSFSPRYLDQWERRSGKWLVHSLPMASLRELIDSLIQPPRRRGAPAAAAIAEPSKPRLTKLAKENNITNEQESEIREAFLLFAVEVVPEFKEEKMGVMKVDDVRRCLMSVYSFELQCLPARH